MAMRTIETGQLFVGAELLAQCASFDLDIKTGDEQAIATDGSAYHQHGVPTSGASIEMVVPNDGAGSNARFNRLASGKEDFVLTGFVGGEFGSTDAFVTDVKYKGEAKNGSLMCTGTIVGAEWIWGPPV